MILFLDFFDIEAFVPFNQKFMFDLTWKGRMFYLFFVWLLLLESVLDWEIIVEKQSAFKNRFRVILTCIFAAVPTLYVISVNFFGLDQMILSLGQALQIGQDFINEAWPLSVEHLILLLFFTIAIWLAYGLIGLRSLSISLSLLAGIVVVYLVDTIWPYGTFVPMQLLAVPTAAGATALLDLLGYNVAMSYSSLALSPEYGAMPLMRVGPQGGPQINRYIGWPCAGVHSLLLFTLIALVFFKKTTIPKDRKIIFFLFGAAGTYVANIFRIASFFIIFVHYGEQAANTFHDSYGELYFVAWMIMFVLFVASIQSGKIGRFVSAFRRSQKVSEANAVLSQQTKPLRTVTVPASTRRGVLSRRCEFI